MKMKNRVGGALSQLSFVIVSDEPWMPGWADRPDEPNEPDEPRMPGWVDWSNEPDEPWMPGWADRPDEPMSRTSRGWYRG